jgi:hypothetical protein
VPLDSIISVFSAWSPHKKVLKGNATLTCGKHSVALQAMNFAAHHIASFDFDDLIFCLASRAAEGDWL